MSLRQKFSDTAEAGMFKDMIIIMKDWKQHKHPLVWGWKNKFWHIHRRKQYNR